MASVVIPFPVETVKQFLDDEVRDDDLTVFYGLPRAKSKISTGINFRIDYQGVSDRSSLHIVVTIANIFTANYGQVRRAQMLQLADASQ